MTKKKALSTEAEPIMTASLSDESASGQEPEQELEQEPEQESGQEAVVYLGPDIDRLVNHGTVYAGGIIPEYLQKKIDQVPAIRGLIVPVSRYAEVAREIALPSGRYRTLYDIVSKAN